jgi:hypothetical protein
LPLGGVPGHHSVYEPVQNEAGALAHVTGESRGLPVPRRRPAPEGGGLLRRGRACDCEGLEEKEMSWDGFSPSVKGLGELEDEENAPV